MTILTVLPDSTPTPVAAGVETQIAAGPHAERPGRSPLLVGLSAMAVAVVAVWTVTTVAMLMIVDISFWAAFGLGAYCAFWLGGGFGTIFGSAIVFGRAH